MPLEETKVMCLAQVGKEFRGIMLPVMIAPCHNHCTPMRILQQVLGIMKMMHLQGVEENPACTHQCCPSWSQLKKPVAHLDDGIHVADVLTPVGKYEPRCQHHRERIISLILAMPGLGLDLSLR